MGQIQFLGNKILFVAGKIAMSPFCCCVGRGGWRCTSCRNIEEILPYEVFVELSGITTSRITGSCGELIDYLNGTHALQTDGICSYKTDIPGSCFIRDPVFYPGVRDIRISRMELDLTFREHAIHLNILWDYTYSGELANRFHSVTWLRIYPDGVPCDELDGEEIPFERSTGPKDHPGWEDECHFGCFPGSTARLTVPI